MAIFCSRRTDEQVSVGGAAAGAPEADVDRAEGGLAAGVEQGRVEPAASVGLGQRFAHPAGFKRQAKPHVAAQAQRHAPDDAFAACMGISHLVTEQLAGGKTRQVQEAAEFGRVLQGQTAMG